MKAKTARKKGLENNSQHGDIWTWTAIDADTKLVPSWLVGPRDFPTAKRFIDDLASRLVHRIQLTTDGLKVYSKIGAWQSGKERTGNPTQAEC